MNNAFQPSRLAALALLLCLGLALPSAPAATGPRRAAGPLPAGALDSLPLTLSPEQLQTLYATGELTEYYRDKAQNRLCPVASIKPAMEQSLAGVKPSIGIESLVVVPLPAALAGRADRDLVLFNLLHGFRTMEGIEYWSQSRGVMRVFFLKSHLVKSPADRSALPDQSFSAREPEQRFYLEQEDSSFGKNLYEVSLQGLPDGGLALNMQNLDQVWYSIAPVLSARGLDMHLVLQPSADGKYLYLYGNSGLNAAKVFGLEERAQNSYYNRIVALFNWFVKMMGTVPAA